MKRFRVILLFLVLLVAVTALDEAEARTLVLENGVGLAEVIEIGMARGDIDLSRYKERYGLESRGDEKGIVTYIKCTRDCEAGHGIGIGASRRRVLRRYGSALDIQRDDSEAILYYNGVAFRFNRKERVRAIYIMRRAEP